MFELDLPENAEQHLHVRHLHPGIVGGRRERHSLFMDEGEKTLQFNFVWFQNTTEFGFMTMDTRSCKQAKLTVLPSRIFSLKRSDASFPSIRIPAFTNDEPPEPLYADAAA